MEHLNTTDPGILPETSPDHLFRLSILSDMS